MTKKSLTDFLVNFVVEHTGYPPEIVEMDANLEADLGIDSPKALQLLVPAKLGTTDEYGRFDPSWDALTFSINVCCRAFAEIKTS